MNGYIPVGYYAATGRAWLDRHLDRRRVERSPAHWVLGPLVDAAASRFGHLDHLLVERVMAGVSGRIEDLLLARITEVLRRRIEDHLLERIREGLPQDEGPAATGDRHWTD